MSGNTFVKVLEGLYRNEPGEGMARILLFFSILILTHDFVDIYIHIELGNYHLMVVLSS